MCGCLWICKYVGAYEYVSIIQWSSVYIQNFIYNTGFVNRKVAVSMHRMKPWNLLYSLYNEMKEQDMNIKLMTAKTCTHTRARSCFELITKNALRKSHTGDRLFFAHEFVLRWAVEWANGLNGLSISKWNKPDENRLFLFFRHFVFETFICEQKKTVDFEITSFLARFLCPTTIYHFHSKR